MLFVIVAIGVSLRWAGMMNELWLDEIWSLRNALEPNSWTGIFTTLQTDNNHHLNSLWLRSIGLGAPAWAYRAMSFAAGVATIPLAYAIGRRDSERLGVLMALFIALSYLTGYYASEARGYASLMFFTLVAWFFLQAYVSTLSVGAAAGFWLAAVGGLVSHSTFIVFFIAAVLWGNAALQQQRRPGRDRQAMAIAFGVPTVFLVGFYLTVLRGMIVAGGPERTLADVVGQSLSLLISGPAGGWLMAVVAVGVALATGTAVVMLQRRHAIRWLMYTTVIGIAPALLLIAQPNALIYPRYFLIPGLFVLLALAELCSLMWSADVRGRTVVVGAVSMMSVGAAGHAWSLAALGRGHFDLAAAQLAAAATSGSVTVAAVSPLPGVDGRTRLQLDYHLRRLNAAERVSYEDAGHELRAAEWLVRESFGDDIAPEEVTAAGSSFRRVAHYPAAELAGINWTLYKLTSSLGGAGVRVQSTSVPQK